MLCFVNHLLFLHQRIQLHMKKLPPVFIDSEKDTWNMSPSALRKAFDKYEAFVSATRGCMLLGKRSKGKNSTFRRSETKALQMF